MYNDDYVLLDDEDFAQAMPEKSKLIEIEQFVDEKEVDTMYYESPYYIEPEKGGTKAYGLLREALKKSGKIAIATFVMRSSETLCVLKPKANLLVLNKIRFAEEIRDTSEFTLPDAKDVKPAELKMALTLIEQFSEKLDLTKFKDEYASELMKVIKAKATGKETKVRKLVPETIKTKDLMEQLKASLATGGKKKAAS
jgi:DNA end-binding protein Ku